MSNLQITEGSLPLSSLALSGTHDVYTKTWRPASSTPLKARMILVHGFSDHCNNYEPLVSLLAEQGIAVHGFDQRGWGRSVHTPAEKGRSGATSQVLDDMTFFTKHVLEENTAEDASVPVFLYGHSMGGAQVLNYAALGPSAVVSQIRGFLVESPFIALNPASRPWRMTVVMGRFAGKVFPNRPMVQKLKADLISRDPQVIKEFEADPLNHDTGTLEGLAGMLDRAHNLETGLVILGEGRGEGGLTRLWVSHGTADGICDYTACRKWFDGVRCKDKEMRVYEGAYHVLHKEPGEEKIRFAQDVSKWILDRSGENGRAKL